MQTSSQVPLGGHKGLGNTDHPFFAFRNPSILPVENTRASIRAAFNAGASYVEIDVVTSRDLVPFLIHNVVPKDHFFGGNIPPRMLNQMSWHDIRRFKTGPASNGAIASLAEVLNDVKHLKPRGTPWVLNIEIKGVQGSKQADDLQPLVDAIARTTAMSGINPTKILFSGFAVRAIALMAHRFPTAHYAMLFAEGGTPDPVIYPARGRHPEFSYRDFTPGDVQDVFARWSRTAPSYVKLGYLNPEVGTITPDMIAVAQKHGAGINSWAWLEKTDAAQMTQYRRVAADCAAAGVAYTAITDYLPEVRAALP